MLSNNAAMPHSPYQNSPTSNPPSEERCSIYLSQVLTQYVPNFIAMAMRVARGKIQLAAFDGPFPKTPLQMQKSCRYLLHRPSYSKFRPKICCHGNRGRQGKNLNDTINRAGPKIGVRCKQHAIIFCGGQGIVNLSQNMLPWQVVCWSCIWQNHTSTMHHLLAI